MPSIRRGSPIDLPEVEAIQQASPEAAQWRVADYLEHDFLVAEDAGGRVAGFLVARRLAPGEGEILNVAVNPRARRNGIGRHLVAAYLADTGGTVFLEVRASNGPARALYNCLGFLEVNQRPDYYQDPLEAAVVLKFHSC
jgi:[ribosomal protein S18]-alanine N-acetyltransferase